MLRGIYLFPVMVLSLIHLAFPAAGDLQRLTVHGTVSIEGDYWTNLVEWGSGLRVHPLNHFRRPVSSGPGIYSWASFDQGGDVSLISQRTRISISADLTDRVAAFVEFDSVDTWGQDFRSNYATGADGRGDTGDDTEMYQSYIDVASIRGTPLSLRVGRQELVFGKGWLMGNNTSGPIPYGWGLSFDALRLGWKSAGFSADAFVAKLPEHDMDLSEWDVDLIGLYGSYSAFPEVTLDAYWLWLRDHESRRHTRGNPTTEVFERLLGVDQYHTTNLHTVGMRLAGARGAFGFDLEAAYQFGEADAVGFLFDSLGYGDQHATFGAWGCDLQLNYAFHAAWNPNVFAGFALLQGEEHAHGDFLEWINPFYRPKAAIAFNRLFSDTYYSAFMDGSELSNLAVLTAGVELQPAERLGLAATLSHLSVDKPYVRSSIPFFTFLHKKNDEELGWELALDATYAYSDDLNFFVGYARLFTGPGARQGSFVSSNGLDFLGGSAGRDLSYFYWYAEISF